MQESVKRRLQRDDVRGADKSDRHWIDEVALTAHDQGVQAFAVPGAMRDLDESAALRRSFKLSFARRRQRGSKFGDFPQDGIVIQLRRPVRMRQQHAVAKARTVGKYRGKPIA